jgi:hypothetical protein
VLTEADDGATMDELVHESRVVVADEVEDAEA